MASALIVALGVAAYFFGWLQSIAETPGRRWKRSRTMIKHPSTRGVISPEPARLPARPDNTAGIVFAVLGVAMVLIFLIFS